MTEYVCAFACDQAAVGVVPTTNPDASIRRRPICDQHVKELLPQEPEGFRVVQMFGAIDPFYRPPAAKDSGPGCPGSAAASHSG